jgi:hypothetical protein
MSPPQKRQYGHAFCVGCEADLDLTGHLNKLPISLGNETLYLCHCDRCARKISMGGLSSQRQAIDRAEAKLRAVNVRAAGYALISEVALAEHDRDQVKAYELGTSLPVHIHIAIMKGKADLTKIGDVTIVCSTRGDES